MSQENIITARDFEEVLQTTLSPELRKQCAEAVLKYEKLTLQERESYILEVIKVLFKDDLVSAGEHRIGEWEKGWKENLDAFKKTKDINSIIPRYHGKHKLLHWKQDIIRPLVPNFDYHIHILLVDWVIETFLSKLDNLYEFGCGPAYHLLRARRFNPSQHLVGLDWAKSSQSIISEIVSSGIETNIEGHNFDFHEPDYSIKINPNSGILTVAALEQVGDRFEHFLQYLLHKKPTVCVHLEPIDELMDENNLIDMLSVMYFRKRNYLKGFLTRLRELQEQGKIKIIKEQRTYSGSFFIEGHSLIIWKPV